MRDDIKLKIYPHEKMRVIKTIANEYNEDETILNRCPYSQTNKPNEVLKINIVKKFHMKNQYVTTEKCC